MISPIFLMKTLLSLSRFYKVVYCLWKVLIFFSARRIWNSEWLPIALH